MNATRSIRAAILSNSNNHPSFSPFRVLIIVRIDTNALVSAYYLSKLVNSLNLDSISCSYGCSGVD